MNILTYETNTRQAEHKRKKKKCYSGNEFFKFLSASNAAMATIDTWAHEKRLMANRIIEISTWGHGHQYTRSYIRKFYGYTTRTVTRLIKDLERMGLIQSTVLFKRPNKYQPGIMALNDFVRQSLVSRLPALRLILSLVFLLSKPDVSLIRKEYTEEKSVPFMLKKKTVSGTHSPWLVKYLEFIDAQFPVSSDNVTQRSSMNAASNPIFPVLENLSSIELAPHGIAQMQAFPIAAIREADRSLAVALKNGNVTNPFGYMHKVASMWCKDNNHKPDYRYANQLTEQQGLTQSDAKYVSLKITEERKSVRTSSQRDWRQELKDQREAYEAEQAELPYLTRDQKKERMRPAVANYLTLSSGIQDVLIKIHPFPDAKELMDELIVELKTETNNVLVATWTPIAQSMGAYTPQRRAQVLTENGFSEHIPLVEELIAKMGAV